MYSSYGGFGNAYSSYGGGYGDGMYGGDMGGYGGYGAWADWVMGGMGHGSIQIRLAHLHRIPACRFLGVLPTSVVRYFSTILKIQHLKKAHSPGVLRCHYIYKMYNHITFLLHQEGPKRAKF